LNVLEPKKEQKWIIYDSTLVIKQNKQIKSDVRKKIINIKAKSIILKIGNQ
jgi:hypothetical protein